MVRTAAPSPADTRAESQPAATFQVRGILVLGMRSLFIVRGTVVTGSVRVGQRVLGLSGMDAAVTGVEARLLDVNGGAAQTALTFHYTKQAQLAQWTALVTEGTLLTLGTPA